jgi:hypothetical protein
VAANRRTSKYPQIGAILVEKQLITEDQLAWALSEQQETGRLLGEICVARFGLNRMSLADVLAAQWDGMQSELPQETEACADDPFATLLEETKAARDELKRVTQEFGERLAVLEGLVASVGDAIGELSAATPLGSPRRRRAATEAASASTPPAKPRSRARSTAPQAAT